MNDYRGIFAILSAAAGLIMLIAALRYSFSKKPSVIRRKRVFTSLTYGVLFLIAGGVLWSRHGQVNITEPPQQTTDRNTPQPPQQITQRTPPVVTDSLQRQAAVEAKKQSASQGESSHPTTTPQNVAARTQSLPRHRESIVAGPAREHRSADNELSGRPPKEAEARIAWMVTRAFSVIEAFFDKYASPVNSSTQLASRSVSNDPSQSIHFPRVTFEEQSADISPESEPALRTLARELKNDPSVNLEIQARVDSVGSEALNYMLTQARAAAVRDFLVVEGVPAERLIARGFGTQQFPHGTNNLIAFVVRR
jgi:outer membrane protein OmpA-like peptidoglycan-associated protein